MNRQILDHRGPDFKISANAFSRASRRSSRREPGDHLSGVGHRRWEAALTNTLSPGDHVLMVETGQFAVLWKQMADRLGLNAEVIATDWRIGVDPAVIEQRLAKDKGPAIKAVCVVHNETSTGCRTRLDEIRKAIDAAKHPALYMTDSISGLAAADLRQDEWGIDVTIAGLRRA